MAAATASQIASICNVKESSIEVVIQSVQQQRHGTDCGVFAIAFATSLGYGEDPSKTFYDTTKLRDHLIKCLEADKMSLFPKISKRSNKILKCKGLWDLLLPYAMGSREYQ